MRKKKHKIVVPSKDAVAEFGTGIDQKEDGPTEPEPAASEAAPAEQPADGDDAATAEVTSEAEQWKEKCLRARAELLNYQRRAEKSRSEALKYANAPLVRALLPMIEDLERVIASGLEHPENGDAIVDGMKLTLDNLLKVFRAYHVEAIQAEGEPFDPEVHEAMMEQPSPQHADRVVLQELSKGYRLHDRVLRPAKVIVSKAVETDHTDEGDGREEAKPSPDSGDTD